MQFLPKGYLRTSVRVWFDILVGLWFACILGCSGNESSVIGGWYGSFSATSYFISSMLEEARIVSIPSVLSLSCLKFFGSFLNTYWLLVCISLGCFGKYSGGLEVFGDWGSVFSNFVVGLVLRILVGFVPRFALYSKPLFFWNWFPLFLQ